MNKKMLLGLVLLVSACGAERNKNRQPTSSDSFRPSEPDIDNQEDFDSAERYFEKID